jgi:hypothetical protein
MAIPKLSPIDIPDHYGYSCQSWIKSEIERLCYGKSNIWFATHFSAHRNVDSSNPCFLYFELSRAVRLEDYGHRFIESLRNQLLNTVNDSGLTTDEKVALKDQLLFGDIGLFRPRVWLIDLPRIAERRGCSVADLKDECRKEAEAQIEPPQRLQPNEYFIRDLQQAEITIDFEVLIDG